MKNLFIIGSPRSGTTFLAKLLKNTQYGAPYETHFILKYSEKLAEFGDLDDFSNFSRLVNAIVKERPIAQHKPVIDLQTFHDALSKPVKYIDVVNYICSVCVNKTPDQSWGDKTPHYILKLKKLVDLYPEAKFIYLVRDGRDVATSLLRKSWGPNNIAACAKDWINANNSEVNQLVEKLNDSGQLIAVKYEALLSDYENQTKAILEFLDEPVESHQSFIDEQKLQLKKNNFFKWKLEMTPRQIKDYEALAGDVLNMHQYEITTDYKRGLSFPKKLGYKLHNSTLIWKNLFMMNVIDGIKIKILKKDPFPNSPDVKKAKSFSKPNFMVIGAARSGTTSLFKYLEIHPDIYMSPIKEINYFSNKKTMKKSLSWYLSHFDGAKTKLIGEASTSYTLAHSRPGTPDRIQKALGDIKFIYLLRDPIERLISHYLHHVHRGEMDACFDSYVNTMSDPMFAQGKYAYQIDEYLKYYNRDDILVITIEELKNTREETISKLYEFLGVDTSFASTKFDKEHNSSLNSTVKTWFGVKVLRFYKNFIEQVNLPYRFKKLFLQLAEVGSKPLHRPTLTPEQHQKLVDYYQEDLVMLNEKYGVDTSSWKNFQMKENA